MLSNFAASLLPNDMPEDWRLVSAGTALTDSAYGVGDAGDSSGEVEVVGMKDIKNGYVGLVDLGRISGSLADYQAYKLEVGDILLNRTNSAELVGKAEIVASPTDAIFASYLVRLRVDHTTADPFFLAQWLNSDIAQRALKRISTRAVSQANINPTEFKKQCPVPLPPLPEQRKIAGILRTWDEAIEACERLITAKQSRLKATRQKLYALTRPGAYPDVAHSWEETTLGSVFTEVSEDNPGLGAESVITVGKYAIRRQVEHFTRSVASANLSNYQLLNPGDFVYDPMSAYYGAIGRYTGATPGIVSPAYRVIHLADGIAPAFVEGLLKSYYIAFELENRSTQGNREGKRRILRSDEFSSIPFMLPPRAEQDRIADVTGEVSRDLKLTTKTRDALAKQKRGLMQKLLIGEWRVKVDAEAAV